MKMQPEYFCQKSYLRQTASSPEEYLTAALQAEKYIDRWKVVTPAGIFWDMGQDRLSADLLGLYNGSAGILYFYKKLYDTTGDSRWLETVHEAVRFLTRHIQDILPEKIRTIQEYREQVSLDTGVLGIAGIGFVLLEIYESFSWEEAGSALRELRTFYLEHGIRNEGMICWTGSTTMITDCAIILFLIRYQLLFREQKTADCIRQVETWFLSQGIVTSTDTIRFRGLECVWEGIKPNFEVGTAGCGFVLARLYEYSGNPDCLAAARKCVSFLRECMIPEGKGALIPFRLDLGEKSPFYLGTCSGIAGTARLFYLMYLLTQDETYLQDIYSLTAGLEAVGAPEHMSPGLWNTFNLCCGHAGLVQFFVGMYQATGDSYFSSLAGRSASVLLGERQTQPDGSAKWTMALERIHPDRESAPIGYYMGAAGIGAALLQIYMSEKKKFLWKRLPDDPFPENA